ncbi:hypothetical protein PRIPAC_80688 [Pristionchus pacificus]|uniref:Uncharacterized protein n=1 Tax=Pristionchus pacificus TaxID=54126 RepID=A0A2A6CN41_PRIPA|nr:hypothetical protein PRIPAC_80688 [Pristionchus pacificus]|eukprot:PDM79614.1 hypothetical protein PRIPAC_32193 [Pristionchus pacificus]
MSDVVSLTLLDLPKEIIIKIIGLDLPKEIIIKIIKIIGGITWEQFTPISSVIQRSFRFTPSSFTFLPPYRRIFHRGLSVQKYLQFLGSTTM